MNVARFANGLVIDLASEADTAILGSLLADLVAPGVVIGLIGPLGAGKTRLVRAIAESLEVDPGAISSPTFVLIHEYLGRMPVFHFDAYRLKSPLAFEELGVADYWNGPGVCLVEWADRVVDLLPTDRWMITLKPVSPTERTARLELPTCASSVIDQLFARLS
jgi:tRNA threonylcarbamoyladenosine biosynthesis protein TsaE